MHRGEGQLWVEVSGLAVAASPAAPASHVGSNENLLLAIRRHTTVWISNVLGEGSPSGLSYSSLDRATGTAVARSKALSCRAL